MMSPMAAPAPKPVWESPAAAQKPGHAGHRSQQGPAVRGDALRPVREVGHLRPAQDGDAPDRALHDLAEELPVRREELLGEVPRHAVHRPGHRLPLEAADQESADLLAEVDEVLRVAEAGRRARQLVPGDRLGGQVLVDERRDRQAHARHRRHLAAPHPGRVDHDLRAHAAAVGDDRRDGAVPRPLDARHADSGLDRHPERPGAPRELRRRPARVDPPVPGQVHGPVEVVGGHERGTAGAPRRARSCPRRGRGRAPSRPAAAGRATGPGSRRPGGCRPRASARVSPAPSGGSGRGGSSTAACA